MEVTQAETEAIKARTAAMREIIGASHMEMVSAPKPEIDEETMACRETTEARLEEVLSDGVRLGYTAVIFSI
jgi:hypothetical protein